MADRWVLRRRGALGDVVLLGSVTGVLARAGAHVTVATAARYRSVAERLEGVAATCDWSETPSGRVVDLDGGLRGRRRPADARIRKRSMRRRLRLWLPRVPPRPSVPELYAEAVDCAPQPAPWIQTPEAKRRDTLVLVPGAAWAPKQWSPERLAAVGARWRGPVVVLGGPGEADLVQRVAASAPHAKACVEDGFDATIRWLARAAVTVSGDSGLMHLAGACGSPVVALFGPTHPDDGFFVYEGEVLQRTLPCRPCALHRVERCRHTHHGCMDHSVDQVWEAVKRCAGSC